MVAYTRSPLRPKARAVSNPNPLLHPVTTTMLMFRLPLRSIEMVYQQVPPRARSATRRTLTSALEGLAFGHPHREVTNAFKHHEIDCDSCVEAGGSGASRWIPRSPVPCGSAVGVVVLNSLRRQSETVCAA